MRTVIVEPEAEAELAEAVGWYDAQGPGLGAALLVEVDETISGLREDSRPSSPIPRARTKLGVRRVILDQFPYSVIFLTYREVVFVIAFAHHKRMPGYWMDRLAGWMGG